MEQLTQALLVNALKHGAIDWIVLIQNCLGLTWQSAPSCHGADAAVSQYADDNERAVYQDILTKVPNDTDAPTNAPSLTDSGSSKSDASIYRRPEARHIYLVLAGEKRSWSSGPSQNSMISESARDYRLTLSTIQAKGTERPEKRQRTHRKTAQAYNRVSLSFTIDSL